MDELISRNEAIKWFFRTYSNEESYSNLDVERALKAIPTVDTAPVVHGYWINHIDDLFPEDSMIECSECHEYTHLLPDDNYCPNCGAKMKE